MPATTLRKTRFDEVALVEVHGTLGIATTPRLRTMLLNGLSTGARRLIVDLSRAKMIDCSAIGVFFSVREHAEQQGGTLRAVAAQGNRGWRIRVPRRLQELRLNVQRVHGDLTQQLGHTPSAAELAGCLNVPEVDILAAQEAAAAYRPASLSEPTRADSDGVLADRLATFERGLDTLENRESLRPALAKLPRREQRIVAMRYYGGLTQAQIAKEIGISQMHVSRLLASSLDRLRGAIAEE